MEQLLAHLVGDYCLQNHWMAINKTTRWSAAMIHALFYGLPFLLLISTWWQWAVIVGTHLLIDRFRLASYWVRFWGIGTQGTVVTKLFAKRMTDEDGVVMDQTFVMDAPPFLGVWLLIIVDNTMHLGINWAVLRWLA